MPKFFLVLISLYILILYYSNSLTIAQAKPSNRYPLMSESKSNFQANYLQKVHPFLQKQKLTKSMRSLLINLRRKRALKLQRIKRKHRPAYNNKIEKRLVLELPLVKLGAQNGFIVVNPELPSSQVRQAELDLETTPTTCSSTTCSRETQETPGHEQIIFIPSQTKLYQEDTTKRGQQLVVNVVLRQQEQSTTGGSRSHSNCAIKEDRIKPSPEMLNCLLEKLSTEKSCAFDHTNDIQNEGMQSNQIVSSSSKTNAEDLLNGFNGATTPSLLMEEILKNIEEIHTMQNRSAGEEGLPCNITGSWSSSGAGVLLNITKFNRKLGVTLNAKVPPADHSFLGNYEDWCFIGMAPFASSSRLILNGINHKSKQITTFIGECRFCEGYKTVSGTWLLTRPARDCNDQKSTLEIFGDVWRRETLTELRKERWERIKRLKDTPKTDNKKKKSVIHSIKKNTSTSKSTTIQNFTNNFNNTDVNPVHTTMKMKTCKTTKACTLTP